MTCSDKPQICFLREITVQYRGQRLRGPLVSEPGDVKRFLDKVMKDNAREHFIGLYLDAAHRVASYSAVSTGLATSCQIHPREVFQPAILSGAVSIIVAHNHPSGQLRPSDADRDITKRLISCGELLGIKVLDHLIVSDEGYISFADRGWMTGGDPLKLTPNA